MSLVLLFSKQLLQKHLTGRTDYVHTAHDTGKDMYIHIHHPTASQTIPLVHRAKQLTSFYKLPGHEQSSGSSGTVVVNIDDGNASETQTMVDRPLPTGWVTFR